MSKLNILLFKTLNEVLEAVGGAHEEDLPNRFKKIPEKDIRPNRALTVTDRRRGEVNTVPSASETASNAKPASRKRLKEEQR